VKSKGRLAKEQAILRLAKEPYDYYDESRIHRALMQSTNDFMDLLERFYKAWDKNDKLVELPRKQLFTTPGIKGDWRVMPCVVNRFEGKSVKAVKVIGTNEEERVVSDKISVGKALLIHPTDNFVKAIFDVCALSSFRTAAISVLALKYLTEKKDRRVGVIGVGRVGFYTVLILQKWLGAKEIGIFDINKKRVDLLKQSSGRRTAAVLKSQDLKEICKSNNAVFLATDTASPLISSKNASGLKFISSVGADADNLSELHKSILRHRTLVSESRQNIHFGDLKRWAKAKLIRENNIVELQRIIGRRKRMRGNVVFVSTGTAVQDALICQFLFDRFFFESLLFYRRHQPVPSLLF